MTKARVTELAAQIREAVRLHDPVARAVVELVKLSLDETKDTLVQAEGEDIPRVQGAARHLSKLHKELTVTPPSIVPPTTQEQ
jgi:hypothetical protein